MIGSGPQVMLPARRPVRGDAPASACQFSPSDDQCPGCQRLPSLLECLSRESIPLYSTTHKGGRHNETHARSVAVLSGSRHGSFARGGRFVGHGRRGTGEGRKTADRCQGRPGQVAGQNAGQRKGHAGQVALGKKLYFEKTISINRTQSCNSCHRVDENLGGVDNLPTSKGAEGKFGGRNAPTTLNAGLHVAQFWDGRAPDLAAQAKGPVLNPIEMGMPNEAAVLERLKEADYEPLFKQAFPDARSR